MITAARLPCLNLPLPITEKTKKKKEWENLNTGEYQRLLILATCFVWKIFLLFTFRKVILKEKKPPSKPQNHKPNPQLAFYSQTQQLQAWICYASPSEALLAVHLRDTGLISLFCSYSPDLRKMQGQLYSETSWENPELCESNDEDCWGAKLSHSKGWRTESQIALGCKRPLKVI